MTLVQLVQLGQLVRPDRQGQLGLLVQMETTVLLGRQGQLDLLGRQGRVGLTETTVLLALLVQQDQLEVLGQLVLLDQLELPPDSELLPQALDQ